MTKLDPSKVHEKFRPFIGDQHNRLPESTLLKGGCVDFGAHVGKPLSDRLWEDLEYRLHVTILRIYHERDSFWLDDPGHGSAQIVLDDNYLVKTIEFVPYPTPKMIRILMENKDKPKIVFGPDVKAIDGYMMIDGKIDFVDPKKV